MDRRNFIAGLSAAGMTAASTGLPAQSNRRVAVVGAGIIGASIAWNLSRRGCDVLIFDKRGPATQASGNSFAWINAAFDKMPFSYHLLSTYGINEYRRLQRELELPIRWGGSLEWYTDREPQQELENGVGAVHKYGSPTWIIDTHRAAELEPNLQVDAAQRLAWCRQDGAIDSAAATHTLVGAAVGHGATMVAPAQVSMIEQNSTGMIVETDMDSFVVDDVVIAAGVGSTNVASMLGLALRQRSTPGVIVTTRPMERIINTVLYGPGLHIHQRDDGRVVLGEKAGAPKTDEHREFLVERPNAYPSEELAHEHASRILTLGRQFVPQLESAEVERVGVGWRPMPMDGRPIIGRPKNAPGAYIAVMHSGITLAAIVGRLAAMEILDGVSIDLLQDFRLERF